MTVRETDRRLVYSTGPGGESPKNREAEGGPRLSLPPERQEVRVRRERGGRRGKTVTVAGPLLLAPEEAKALLRQWKRTCGGGGSLKMLADRSGYEVEIQGDHAERLLAELLQAGFRAKRSGG